MPGYDGTGPRGMGAMTGRGYGPCGRGMVLGRGYGRFSGRNYLSRREEIEDLEDEAKDMEADLKALRERINDIKGQ
jgi:hypothetical protein